MSLSLIFPRLPGRSIVAIVTDEQQRQPLLLIDVRTGETRVLIQPTMPEMISGVTVSPDGRTLYMTRRRFVDEGPEAGSEQIVARDMATGA